MRRLVFLTQSVDPAHPVLAATIPKIRALAERVDEVVVLTQSGDGDGLPANVEVRTFGGPSRVQRVWRFQRELARRTIVLAYCSAVVVGEVYPSRLVTGFHCRPLRMSLVLLSREAI